MCKDSNSSTIPRPLDTLVQLPPNCPKKVNLKKRARSKFYTQSIAAQLIQLDSPLKKYYQRAFYCCQEIYQEGQQLKGSKYCNTRLCHTCNRIRTAKLIKGYIKQLEGRNLELVTLTIPNVKKSELSNAISKMIKDCSLIIRNMRERRKIDINGIRKIEATHNDTRNDYHPHIHLLVDKAGSEIVKEWIKRNPTASIKAQDVRAADQNSLNELFKYTTKIAAKASKQGEIDVHIEALDVIISALFGKRSIQPFGDVRKVSEEVTDELTGQTFDELAGDHQVWIWQGNDWVSMDGECLTDYNPPDVVFKFHLSPAYS